MIAASSKPDLAFQWIEEVLKTDQTLEALRDSGKFVTLDAKLTSSLTNICEGGLCKTARHLQGGVGQSRNTSQEFVAENKLSQRPLRPGGPLPTLLTQVLRPCWNHGAIGSGPNPWLSW